MLDLKYDMTNYSIYLLYTVPAYSAHVKGVCQHESVHMQETYFLDSCQVSDGGLDRGRDTQGDITEHLFIMLIPGIMVFIRARSTEDEPLTLGPEVGLHGSVPQLPVRTGEDQDHLVKSAGHSDKSCWESTESASECNIRQAKRKVHLALVKALCQQLYSRLGNNWCNLAPDCAVAATWLCRSSTWSSLSSTVSS